MVFLVLLTLSSCVSPILFPFGYKHNDTSKVGAVLIVSGIFGSFVHGLFLSRTKQYKVSFQFIVLTSTISMMGLVTVLYLKLPFWAICIAAGILGFSIIPVCSASIEFGCELAYPIGNIQK